MADGDESNPLKTAPQIAASLAKDVYQDALQPPMRVLGSALEGIMQAVAHYPRYWGLISNISLEEKRKRFEEKLKNKAGAIPEEHRVLPHPNIVGPVIQALEYSIFNDELSDMFSSLLTGAMDSRTAGLAHPAFAEVIKQLTVDEAKIIKSVSSKIPVGYKIDAENSRVYDVELDGNPLLMPIINVSLRAKDGFSQQLTQSNICGICAQAQCSYPERESAYIDNIIRLGVLEVKFTTWLADDSQYSGLQNAIYERPRSLLGSSDYASSEQIIEKGILRLTEFGRSFIAVCVIDPSDLFSQWQKVEEMLKSTQENPHA